MYKYTVEFTKQDRTQRGLHFKTCKKTVKAATEAEAFKKIENALNDTVYDAKTIAVIGL